MIQATIDGNVGTAPELRATKGGKAVCSFSLASTHKVGTDKLTTWVEVTCWEEMAEMVAERVHKGQRVVAAGRLHMEEFTRKDGTVGVKLKLVADDLGVSLRWRPRSEQAAAGREAQPAADDTIPF